MPDHKGFGLYVHWPFCQAKCPYCDFNSHVTSKVNHLRWSNAFVSEIERLGSETQGRVLDSIFFGGGTPSLMSPETVDSILSAAFAQWNKSNSIEITLEANPTSVEVGKFRDFKSAGINRVSVGLQALNDGDLRLLGRLHSAEEGRRAFDVAQKVFSRASFDLIYARQNQSVPTWKEELAKAIAMGASHMSLYQLTIETGTMFGDRHARGRLPGIPNDDLSAAMFDLTQELTTAAGLPPYEISNHATPGEESVHNLNYWRSGDWVGVGPGAHGRLTIAGRRNATSCPDSPTKWLTSVEKGSGEHSRELLSKVEEHTEGVMMGLRKSEGISLDQIGTDLEKISYINGLTDYPLLEIAEARIRLTPAGRPLLNSVLRELLA
ncbi:MAG: coproporphyrinogen III oxidase [Boseongicola sp.]|nr:MAG: coproporphyrinogen III oxidase [Boseongicola sp.]